MQSSRQQLLEQFSNLSKDGLLGDEIRSSQDEYASLPNGIAKSLKVVADYRQGNVAHPEMAEIREMLFSLIVVAYREARRADLNIAYGLIDGFIGDYPGVPESCLLPKWCSLANASIAMREVIPTANKLLVWQQACKLVQAYNEFLNGLLSYLIILWRTAQGKSINTAVFSINYANKINQFRDLTNGDDGAFYLIFRITQPKLRNATAHESIWLDSETNKVKYIDGRPPVEHEIDLVEFMTYQAIGSHIGQPYLAAIALIAVMVHGTEQEQAVLPEDLITLFNFVPASGVAGLP